MGNPTRETTCGHSPYHAKSLCKKCYLAAHYQANRERHAELGRAWREANPGRAQEINRAIIAADPERAREYQRQYHAANAAERRARVQAWREANPDRVRESARAGQNRRRARKYANADLTDAQWQAILVEFDHRCAYCNVGGVPMEMEHMTPLSRGGRHTASNVVPSCGPCNRSKHMRTALEWIGPEWRPDGQDR